MKKLVCFGLVACFLSLFLSGCGDSNIFSWMHKSGKDSSTTALRADAQKALTDKNYDKAIELYNRILASNPKDSVARYGLAQAEYGKSGISLASMISSTLDSVSGAPAQIYSSAPNMVTNYSLVSKSGSNNVNLFPIDQLQLLYEANQRVIDNLKFIADGHGDGVIPADDPDVNLNLSIALVIQSALFILDTNADGKVGSVGDIITIDGDYKVHDNGISTLTGTAIDKFKNQLKKSMICVVGTSVAQSIFTPDAIPSGYDNYRGAVDYLNIVIASNKVPQLGMMADLRDNFLKLCNDNSNGLKYLWSQV
jgi:hypothetical protein